MFASFWLKLGPWSPVQQCASCHCLHLQPQRTALRIALPHFHSTSCVASGTVEPWFPSCVGPQEPPYTLLPGTAYKATPWVGCKGAAEPKARQCARHLCFSAQLALSEEQANPLSVLAAAFIPWGQSSDVFKATLLGSIPGFICMLGMISPVAFFSHAGASSPQQRLRIPISSKHVLKERIFCLWILPDGIQWLVGLIYEASRRKKLLDLTEGSSPPFWSFPSQTSNYSSWAPAAEPSPLLLYQYPLDIFQEQSGKHFQQMLLMSLCLPRDADSCFGYHYEKASLFKQENKWWFFPKSLISLVKQHLHSLAKGHGLCWTEENTRSLLFKKYSFISITSQLQIKPVVKHLSPLPVSLLSDEVG